MFERIIHGALGGAVNGVILALALLLVARAMGWVKPKSS
jgi:hypothetical protein